MNKQQVIQAVKSNIARAKTPKALSELITFLEGNQRYRSMGKVARLAQAKYEGAERDFNQGLIEKEDANLVYNAVNRTVLQLVEDVENDSFELSHYEPDMRPNTGQKNITKVLVGIFLILVAGLGFWIYTTTKESAPTTISEKLTCPSFTENSEFNVLLLPFQPNKTEELTPHITIKRRLADKSATENLNTSIEIDTDYFNNHDTPGESEASAAGHACGAQMVIWGIWEKQPAGIIISTDFKYLGLKDKIGFQKLKLESDDQIDTVFTLLNIETQGHLTQDIEAVIDNYFGLIAGFSNQPQAAIESLKKGVPSTKDTTAFILNQMTLANSYLAVGDNQAAYDVYDKILTVNPNQDFARNNRGVLLYEKGRYVEAVEDLDVKLAKTPNDADALIVRANANIKLDDLHKAEEDLQRAKIIQPNKLQLESTSKVLEKRKREKMKTIETTTNTLKTKKNSLSALNRRAAAYESLGQHEMAIKDANRAIELSSKDSVAYETLIEAYVNKKDSINVNTILKQARQKGINLNKIEKKGYLKNIPKS